MRGTATERKEIEAEMFSTYPFLCVVFVHPRHNTVRTADRPRTTHTPNHSSRSSPHSLSLSRLSPTLSPLVSLTRSPSTSARASSPLAPKPKMAAAGAGAARKAGAAAAPLASAAVAAAAVAVGVDLEGAAEGAAAGVVADEVWGGGIRRSATEEHERETMRGIS